MPMNITTTSQNTTHNIVTWDKPFTLDITDVDPDIIGYTVCSTIRDSHECSNVTATEFVIPKYYLDVNTDVTITARNIVGESPVASYSINPNADIKQGV